jgi:hypothetical protein
MLCPHGSDFESTTNGPVLFTTLLTQLWIGFNAKNNFLPNLLFLLLPANTILLANTSIKSTVCTYPIPIPYSVVLIINYLQFLQIGNASTDLP